MKEGKIRTNVKVQKNSKAPVRPPDGERRPGEKKPEWRECKNPKCTKKFEVLDDNQQQEYCSITCWNKVNRG